MLTEPRKKPEGETVMWWWLSFCDPEKPAGQRFVGVTLVRGSAFLQAVQEAHRLGINPGGEVKGTQIPEPAPKFRNRLLGREETENIPPFEWKKKKNG